MRWPGGTVVVSSAADALPLQHRVHDPIRSRVYTCAQLLTLRSPTSLPSGTATSTPSTVSPGDAIARPRTPVAILRHRSNQGLSLALASSSEDVAELLRLDPANELIGYIPAVYPEWLGDAGFCRAHDVRFPYVAGAMANG